MCTCLEIKNKNHYFGRTLDLDRHAKEEAVITPRNYIFHSSNLTFRNKYALIGTAMVLGSYPLYYEACNEFGLAMAGLNFPINNKYEESKDTIVNLSSSEIIPYILGNFKSIKELKQAINNIHFVDVAFHESIPSPSLHYMLSDGNECIVIEQTSSGLHVYDNEYGVMTNNPPFPKQVENIKKYQNLTNTYVAPKDAEDTCVGLGSVGLPGDYSSMSRFVKTAFLRKHASLSENEEDNVSTFFHILDSVSMIKGTVLNKNNDQDITFYSSCINTTLGIYYYKTYNNNQIHVLKLTKENITSSYLTRIELDNSSHFNYLNS